MEGVTTLDSRRGSYHHGDLRNALCESAIELARQGGPGAVVLREAARRVGVSATAAYRHFTNHSELMYAVKRRALDELATALRSALDRDAPTGDDGADAVRDVYTAGHAYIGFALTETGLFRSAFTHSGWPLPVANPSSITDLSTITEQASIAEPPRPDWVTTNHTDLPAYGILVRLMDELVTTGRLAPARRDGADVLAWSTVHGLANLLLDGPLARLPEHHRQAAIDRTIDLMVAGLVTPG
jgi:AcrR family transcriptional regulator